MLSVIIPSYKRPQILSGVVLSLQNQTFIKNNPLEVLVSIDQGDPSIADYKSYVFQINSYFSDSNIQIKVELVINDTKGLVFAKNNAVNKSKYDYLFMMDDDLFLEGSYLKTLFSNLKDKNVGACSGFIVSYTSAISHTQPSDYFLEIPKEKLLQKLILEKNGISWRSVFGSEVLLCLTRDHTTH